MKQIALNTTLTDVSGGFRHGAALHGLTLTSADGDISGDAAVGLAARNSLVAVLKSNRIDLDALQAAVDQMPPAAAQPAATRRRPRSPQSGAQPPVPPAKAKRAAVLRHSQFQSMVLRIGRCRRETGRRRLA